MLKKAILLLYSRIEKNNFIYSVYLVIIRRTKQKIDYSCRSKYKKIKIETFWKSFNNKQYCYYIIYLYFELKDFLFFFILKL